MKSVRAVLVVAALVLSGCSDKPARIGTGGATPSTAASSDPATPSHFPAFWPAATFEAAEELQKKADDGDDASRLDPAKVAADFGKARFEWTVQIVATNITGSAADGWKATLTLRPLIGEGEPPTHPGPLHTAELIGLVGAAKPVWFLRSLRSESIVLDTPAQDAVVSSPLQVSGKGAAYEGTIVAEIADDNGKKLDPPSGNILQGGAAEPAPFSGTLTFSTPTAPAGTLSLLADTGAGPTPSATIIRIRFQPAP
jgi:immunoglobulin-like protein involved in spore germination